MNISKSTLHRWWTSYHKFLHRCPLQRRKVKKTYKTKYDILHHFIKSLFTDNAFVPHFIKDFRKQILSLSINPSHTTIWRYVKKNKITRKYCNVFKVNPYSKSDIEKKWTDFYNTIRNIPDEEIVCIDETSFCNHANNVQFYLPIGVQPSHILLPKREKMSFVFCIDNNHVIHHASSTKAFSTSSFTSFFEDLIKNKLDDRHKTIIMDNIAFHKSDVIKRMAEKHDINIIFTPPYSPFCNPIEEVFSLMKRYFYSTYVMPFHMRIERTLERSTNYDTLPFYRHFRNELQKRIRDENNINK